jgi:hypothetical protein
LPDIGLSNGKRGTVFCSATPLYTGTMQHFHLTRPLVQTPEELIQNYLECEIDPLAIERLFTDMVLHYIRPSTDWNPSPEDVYRVIEYPGFVLELLRAIFPHQE